MTTRRTTGAHLLSHCEQLAGARLTFPFGPEPAVFKVGGRMFALFNGPNPDTDPNRVSLKCNPEYAIALIRQHPTITPGYHLNKRHWITVDLAGELPVGLAEELLVDSYDLVVDALPLSRRPLGLSGVSDPFSPNPLGLSGEPGPVSPNR